jgi:hypothetical protein
LKRTIVAALGCAALVATQTGAESEDVALRMASAGTAFLSALDDGPRRSASFAFDDDERFDLRLAPFRLDGLKLSDMNPEQQLAARELLATGLSPRGLAVVETIMSLEDEVLELDARGWTPRWVAAIIRDTEAYDFAVFGDPDPAAPWGLRIEGHHLSLNYTLVPGAVPAASPLFLGGQPREVPQDMARAGLRVLANEEDRARELLAALDPEQRERATLPFQPDRGAFAGAGRRVEVPELVGIARADLTPSQRVLLDALLDAYLSNLAEEIAAAKRGALDRAGRDAMTFGWAGSDVPGEPHYYRVQGPSFLLEFDNSEEAADHIHTLWRDTDGDFGLDLLAEHYAAEH